jgi:hypothetical protein
MQPHEADVIFLVPEQEWRKAHCVPEHDQKDTGDLGIERAGVPDRAPKYRPYPRCDLMA